MSDHDALSKLMWQHILNESSLGDLLLQLRRARQRRVYEAYFAPARSNN